MLRLRQPQVDALEELGLQRFEELLHARLQQHWPARCGELGEPAVRASIREGARRARSYGIVGQRSVGRFVFLMHALGHDFDTSAQTPWAKEILADAQLPPTDRVEALWRRALEHLRH